MSASPPDILELLQATRDGDARAVDRVMPLVYEELRALAAHHLGRERVDHTLQPTALVHEVYLRMLQQREVDWQSRAHFLRIAAQQIRRILVDHARGKGRQRRGGDLVRVTLAEDVATDGFDVNLLELDWALDKLDQRSPEDRSIVELKFFGGLTEPEIAAVLGMGERTVRRRWTHAKAWLLRELGDAPDAPEAPKA